MRLGILFSGGKDSLYAAYLAQKYGHEIACLISIVPENKESFMFHVPGSNLLELQSKAIGIPIIIQKTKGMKEEELEDLENAVKKAVKERGVEGIVTGAVASVYQSSRVQRICNKLKLECFNPLWQKGQIELLNNLVKEGFVVGIDGVAAEPFDESWLGRIIDSRTIAELKRLSEKYGINPAGEGGEYETYVLDSPMHKKRIVVKKMSRMYRNFYGMLKFEEVELEGK